MPLSIGLCINNAFLNGILQETIFIAQPQGFEDKSKPSHVCKLHKALYGLKQAPRAWFDKLKITLVSWGFSHNKADSSLFYFVSTNKVIFILIYVDDIIITASKKDWLADIVLRLHKSSSLKDLGPLFFFFFFWASRSPE